MPAAKALKDLYLFTNTDELQNVANNSCEKNSMLGYSKMLASAEKVFDEARLMESEGDEERAYIYYMRSCNMMQASRKARDYVDKRDRIHWQEKGGKHLMIALQKAEALFQSLQRRYELKRELEEADQAEAMASRSGNESRTSQKSKTIAAESNQGDSDDGSLAQNESVKTTISPYDLYQELQKPYSTVLILDTRGRNEYNACKIKTANCINVPIREMPECYTAWQFEQNLPIADRTHFRQRHTAQHIVLVDTRSSDAEDSLQPGKPLGVLSAAIHQFDNQPTQRPPVMLLGGFDTWHLHYPSVCSNPANYQFSGFDDDTSGFKGNDGYVGEPFSYPDFDSFLADPPVIELIESRKPSSIPSIPDRKTKPSFSKPSSDGGNGIVDIGDYVQLHIPVSNKTPSFGYVGVNEGRSDEETQKVFDNSVSKHIDMRENLNKIGERFRKIRSNVDSDEDENGSEDVHPTKPESVEASIRYNDLLSKVEQKEKEISRIQEVQRLRKLKPASAAANDQSRLDAEEARARIVSLEKEVESLTKQLETKEQERMSAETQARVAEVERLRRERKSREKSKGENAVERETDLEPEETMTAARVLGGHRSKEDLDEGYDERGMRRSQSIPNMNKTPEEVDLATTTSATFREPSFNDHKPAAPKPNVPVPDRSTKPSQPEFDPHQLDRLELEFYTNNIRRLQGPEGRVAPSLTGLKNLGNSCYMNSTIQCLSNITSFAAYFVNGVYRRSINYYNTLGSKGDVARNFAVLLGGLWEGRFKYVIPSQFKNCISKVAPVFAGYDQQDSQEFLVFLLDGLHEDLNLVKERKPIPEQNNDGLKDEDAAHRAWVNHERLNSSIIVNMFQGQYLSIVKCRVCQRESRTFDVFMYLSLPIPSDRKCRLEDCLQKFLAPEDMTGDCKWFCPHCRRKRDAVKKISIWKLPKVLLIHLKRFSCNGRWREKLQTSVDFPTNRLDMSEYARVRGSTYTLLGVSNHYGTMEGGHYTAYCKNANDSRWYKYDDHEVSQISQGSVKSPAAYILYYVAEDYAGEMVPRY